MASNFVAGNVRFDTRANYTLVGGGLTLANWTLEYCVPLGAGVLITEDVAATLPQPIAADLRRCGTHRLGVGRSGQVESESVKLFAPGDRDPYVVPQTLDLLVENFWTAWLMEDTQAAKDRVCPS